MIHMYCTVHAVQYMKLTISYLLPHSFVVGRRKVLSAIIFVGQTGLVIARGKIVLFVDTVIFLRQVTGGSKLQIW